MTAASKSGLPNGVNTTYEYDGMARLTRLKDATTSATLFDRQYGYNPANQIAQITEPTRSRAIGYDNIDRLTSVTDATNSNETYAFNAVGNRTSSHLSSTYSYQPFNKLTATQTSTHGYDANGNMTSKTAGLINWTYTWDFENRMTLAANGTASVSYVYDALGRRVRRTEGLNDTEFTYDGHDVLMDDDTVTGITKYQNGPGIDNKISLKNGGTVNYFLTDHLGSTNGLADSTGAVVSSASYDSFGNQTGNLATRYGYRGGLTLATRAAGPRVFWSGDAAAMNAAGNFARTTGGSTLEMTAGGRAMTAANPWLPRSVSNPFWNDLSRSFANGARGSADVFHYSGGVRTESVWARTEYPILSGNGVNINYHTVFP